MAGTAAETIEMGLQKLEDGIVSRLVEVVGAADFGPARLEAFQASAPLIQDLYLSDLGGRLLFPAREHRTLARWWPQRWRRSATASESVRAVPTSSAGTRFWSQRWSRRRPGGRCSWPSRGTPTCSGARVWARRSTRWSRRRAPPASPT